MTTPHDELRNDLRNLLGIPDSVVDLDAEYRGSCLIDQVKVEKWIWTSEPGSRVTSLLYLPLNQAGTIPGVVVTNGHGASKNSTYAQYTGQLYAKLGMACLLHDTIGEEERHIHGEMGTRAHDKKSVIEQAEQAGRLMMGKMVLDAMRGIDFLSSHPLIDPKRIGVVGNSLGGTVATWLAALESRLKVAIVSGSGISPLNTVTCKPCCSVPFQQMHEICDEVALLSLAAPQCAVLVMNGEQDEIVTQGYEEYWPQHIDYANRIAACYGQHGVPAKFKLWFQPEGGHRAYHLHKHALEWLALHLQLTDWPAEHIRGLPTITLEQWFHKHQLEWPERDRRLYWVTRHHKGGIYADMEISPLPKHTLCCLEPDEVGDAQYTLEGWLERIQTNAETDE